MRKKINAYHLRIDSQWVSLFTEDVGFAELLGLAISKSKRANCDWYKRRRNRRCNSVLNQKQKRPLKYLQAALDLFSTYLNATRADKPVVILPRNNKTAALAKYLVRYGFSSFQQDGQQVFVLTAHQTQAT
jgi:hypothetical protein